MVANYERDVSDELWELATRAILTVDFDDFGGV